MPACANKRGYLPHHAGAERRLLRLSDPQRRGGWPLISASLLMNRERIIEEEEGFSSTGSKPACLDLERGVKGHQRPFVYGEQHLRSRVDTFCLAVDHGGGADECHETCRVIGAPPASCSPWHPKALPDLHHCVQHPFPGRCHGSETSSMM